MHQRLIKVTQVESAYDGLSFSAFGGAHKNFRVRQRCGYRFLQQHVFARFERRHGLFTVQMVWGVDDRYINVVAQGIGEIGGRTRGNA